MHVSCNFVHVDVRKVVGTISGYWCVVATKTMTKLQAIDHSLPKICKVSLITIHGLKGYVVWCLLYNPSTWIFSSGSLSQCMAYPLPSRFTNLVIVCSNLLMKKPERYWVKKFGHVRIWWDKRTKQEILGYIEGDRIINLIKFDYEIARPMRNSYNTINIMEKRDRLRILNYDFMCFLQLWSILFIIWYFTLGWKYSSTSTTYGPWSPTKLANELYLVKHTF